MASEEGVLTIHLFEKRGSEEIHRTLNFHECYSYRSALASAPRTLRLKRISFAPVGLGLIQVLFETRDTDSAMN